MPAKPVSTIGRTNRFEATEEREVLNTEDMILSGFFEKFDGDVQDLAKRAGVDGDGSGSIATSYVTERDPSSAEKAIVTLLEVRDDLVARYASAAGDEVSAALLAGCIGKVEDGMIRLGASPEKFDPAKCKTGLGKQSVADVLGNAKKVVENTKANYGLYKIAKIYAGKASDGRPGIGIEIEGELEGKTFKATGRIVANGDFLGNEAIDYVKDAGKGIMTVRTPKLGYWVDNSSQYEIAWKVS